jgi:hypothetical protein
MAAKMAARGQMGQDFVAPGSYVAEGAVETLWLDGRHRLGVESP